jgi:hypothetical protein
MIAKRREDYVTRRPNSGGAQTAPFDNHDLGLQSAGKRWLALPGLSVRQQHSTSDFIFGQADQLCGDFDLALNAICQALCGYNRVVETRRIMARAALAPCSWNAFIVIHSPPSSISQANEGQGVLCNAQLSQSPGDLSCSMRSPASGTDLALS